MAALTTLAVEAEGLAEELLMPLANKDGMELEEMGENGAPNWRINWWWSCSEVMLKMGIIIICH